MNKDTTIIFSASAQETLEALSSPEASKKTRTILVAVEKKLEHIKNHYNYGQAVAKRLVPKKYSQEGYTTIFRVELPQYWRMLYTITGNKIEVIAFILDIIDHKDYNKLFNYKKK